jgi:hypothetical protein
MLLALASLSATQVPTHHSPSIVELKNSDVEVRLESISDGIKVDRLQERIGHGSWADGSVGTHLVASAEMDGKTIKLSWHLVKSSATARTATFTFQADPIRLSAVSSWHLGPSGPIEHTLSIHNETGKQVLLPLQSTLLWSLQRPASHALQAWWVEKAAGKPSPFGVHQLNVGEGFQLAVNSEPYMSDARAYSTKWEDRSPVPWLSMFDEVVGGGWYAGVEFSGRVSLTLRPLGVNGDEVSLGLSPDDPSGPAFQTRLQPNENYVLPTAFVGCFKGQFENGCNQLKHWVDSSLRPDSHDANYPLLNQNTWGSDMGINEAMAKAMLHQAADLGMEQFHIDAGWFRSVGDWRPNPAKFPNGVAPIADAAHALGLHFGLWVGWTQGGLGDDSTDPSHVLNIRSHPDWFADNYPKDWKPADYTGANLCLSDEDAQKWCVQLLEKEIRENHLDMLEHDQQMIVDSCVQTDHSHTASKTDTAYRATLGYYAVYDAIRKEFPNLMFENCVNGGRQVDFGSAKRASYFSIADSYDPLSNRRAIYDITYVMPPAMCECYVMAMPTKTIPEFRNMLRSGLMGWCSIMQDPTRWSEAQKAAAKQEFALYKSVLRPLVRNGNEFHVSIRPDGINWDGIEYAAQSQESAVLYSFRGTTGEADHSYFLSGLGSKAKYRVHFVDPGQADYTTSGKDLMAAGLKVTLKEPGTSQIVLVNRL